MLATRQSCFYVMYDNGRIVCPKENFQKPKVTKLITSEKETKIYIYLDI